MKFIGDDVIPHPVDVVWDAILDPRVLLETIPGCAQLESVGSDAYAMTVTAGVAAVKGTYVGRCELSNLVPHESLLMSLSGSGAPGTIDAKVKVEFAEANGGGTRISYEADATVGGVIGGVGQRMLSSVSKRMAAEFFRNVGRTIDAGVPMASTQRTEAASAPSDTGAGVATAGTALPRPGRTLTRSGREEATRCTGELLGGIAVGAGLTIVGVMLGAILRRR